MNRLALVASLFAFGTLSQAQPQNPPPKDERKSVERPTLDVVFALDTTSSMSGLIDGAKQKIWSIASRMASGTPTPRVRVGLVAYRDVGDAYVTLVHPLTEDLDGVYTRLMGLRAQGGGDGPEAVHTALAEAVGKMTWTDDRKAARIIFLVGDAPAHDRDQRALEEAARSAIAKGIVVNTIRCGNDGTAGRQFQQVAKLADGRFDSIDQTGGMVAVATPYDAELAKLNGALVDTALYAGDLEAQAAGETHRHAAKAMSAPAAADRASYFARSRSEGSAASFGAVDLTTAPEKAAELPKAALPPPMQAMSKEERVNHARAQQQKRQELEGKIAELAKKRDAYVSTKAADKKDAFDERVFESVKASAAKAGVAY